MTDEKVQLVLKTKDEDGVPEVEKKYPHAYRRKTRWELLRMCIGVVGIDFCYAAETAFVSPTMLKLHVPVTFMTWVWVTPPILGLIGNPLLGSLSDRCRSRLGRRRPFILSMTVGVILGLLLLPNGYSLGQALGDKCSPFHNDGKGTCLGNQSHFDESRINANGAQTSKDSTPGSTDSNSIGNNSMFLIDNPTASNTDCEPNLICPIGIALTVIGLLLMDFSCDGSQSPFRTYVIDLCTEEDQVRGLTTFTIVSGIGGCAGYAIGGVDWESATGSKSFITQLRVVFGTALAIHLICVVFAVTSFREIPLNELQASSDDKGSDFEASTAAFDNTEAVNGGHCLEYGAVSDSEKTKENNFDNNQSRNSGTSLVTYAKSIICLPKCIAWVCFSNFFLWMSMVTLILYFTDFVGQAVYGGSPTAPAGSVESNLYNSGVRLGSIGLAMNAATSSIYSLFIERLVGRFGTRAVYMIGPLASITGAVIIASIRIVPIVLVFSSTIGLTYATLFTMPYIVITKYHEQGMFNDAAGKSSRGLGTDVALVTSMLFLAQIVISLCMGALIQATGSTITIPVTSAITGLIGVLLSSQITHLKSISEESVAATSNRPPLE